MRVRMFSVAVVRSNVGSIILSDIHRFYGQARQVRWILGAGGGELTIAWRSDWIKTAVRATQCI